MSNANYGVGVIERAESKAAEQNDKRLNLILTAKAYADLTAMAAQKRTTMTEIVRQALGLLKVAIAEMDKENKLVVTTADGKVLKELILP